jgi:ATP-dependent protease HslVU (ClpYQ) peptidase subunit
MTTIVYHHKDRQITVDSRLTDGRVIISDTFVKHKFKKSELWFFCGLAADFADLMDLQHNDKPTVAPDASAITVRNYDVWLVTFSEGYCTHTPLEYNCSIGSGRCFALAALDFGKTSQEAAAYAATRDYLTGGELRTYDIGSSEFL